MTFAWRPLPLGERVAITETLVVRAVQFVYVGETSEVEVLNAVRLMEEARARFLLNAQFEVFDWYVHDMTSFSMFQEILCTQPIHGAGTEPSFRFDTPLIVVPGMCVELATEPAGLPLTARWETRAAEAAEALEYFARKNT